MGEWEDKKRFSTTRTQLLLYKRYIDDLFFIWEGSRDSLQEFLNELNSNNNNIRLTSDFSQNDIHFLDVNIFRQGDGLGTKVYFKPTDSNSYLPSSSGHHPKWLKNIPKGQLTRVKRNCSNKADFLRQAQVVRKKFVEKGYVGETLDSTIQELAVRPRDSFLIDQPKVQNNDNHEWSFISGFHSQFREVEDIFNAHWHVLCMDKTLGPSLPCRPKFIYRRAHSFADKIVRKVLDPPSRPLTFWDKKGFYSCRRCRACREVGRPMRALESFTSSSNGREFSINEFITCNTAYVVYAMQCPCGLMYIGRTKRLLRVRIAEHIANIKIGFKDHNVSLHFKLKHNQDPSGLKFWGVDHLRPKWRGSNLVRDLSRRETQWIFLADTLSPRGLNVDLDINCFISDY